MRRDLRSKIYYITPSQGISEPQLIHLVRQMLDAGVGAMQYRVKDRTAAAMIREAAALLNLTRPANVPLIVNDRVDVALAVGADGVHVGQQDMPVSHARRLMGPYAIVGATTPDPVLAGQAERAVASYVSCGPVFASPTKPDKPPVGPEVVQRVQNAVSVPVCAIGGINEDTIHQLAEVNPSLIAVSSAINQASDPGQAARRLVELAEDVLPHVAFGL